MPVDDLPELMARMVGDLADLDAGEERLGKLEQEAREKRVDVDLLAAELSQKRRTRRGCSKAPSWPSFRT